METETRLKQGRARVTVQTMVVGRLGGFECLLRPISVAYQPRKASITRCKPLICSATVEGLYLPGCLRRLLFFILIKLFA